MRSIAVITGDPVVLTPLAAVADHVAARLTAFRDPADLAALAEAPLAIVADLGLTGITAAASAWRAQWPDAFLAAFISRPDRALWEEALAAGFDLVATRGTIPRQLEQRLVAWQGRPRGRRVRLFDVDDIAGRIGVVHRLDDEQVGPIAIYHLGGKIFAAADRCPHAGARLSEGSLERTTITCPLHGSQFDVCTGERLRGPADDPILTYAMEVVDGTAQLLL